MQQSQSLRFTSFSIIDPRYTTIYFKWELKKIFSIFSEQVEEGIYNQMYCLAINSPSLCKAILGGRSITIFLDIFMAFPKILSRGGFMLLGSTELRDKIYQFPKGGDRKTTSGSIPYRDRKSSLSISIFSTQYTLAFVSRHFSLTLQISLQMTLEQVLANFKASPPAPQKPSSTVSHRIFPAMYQATASGVTLYHDQSSSEIPSSNRQNKQYRLFQYLSKFDVVQ